jgi:hypothetical protein
MTTIGYNFGGGNSSYNVDMNGKVNVNQSLYVGGSLAITVSGAERNATFTRVNGVFPTGFQNTGSTGVIFGDVAIDGTITMQSGGLQFSVKQPGTGNGYVLTFLANNCWGMSATIASVGVYGTITCERASAAAFGIYIRNSATGAGIDSAFSFSCAYN